MERHFLTFSNSLNRSLLQVYPNELESQPEFDGFSEWLQTFDLYRGKKSEEDFEEDNRVVGRFKVRFMFPNCPPTLLSQGAIKIYKLPLPKDLDDFTIMGNDPRQGFFQGNIVSLDGAEFVFLLFS